MCEYEIRYAQHKDIKAMADVYVLSWQAAYVDILPHDFLANLSMKRWVDFPSEIIG